MLLKREWYTDAKGKRRGRAYLKCNKCGVESTTSIDNYYQYCKRHGEDTTYCKKCASILAIPKLKGRIPYNKGKIESFRHREKSVNWKGGRYVSLDGYYMILISSDSSKNGWKKYRKEHIVIMEEKLGRKLEKNEVVHHIDGNKLNNDINNLDLINNDNVHHRITHHSLTEIGYELYKNGIIGYCKINKKYFLKERNEQI